MNQPDQLILPRVERLARGTAVVAGLAALGLLGLDPGDFSIAYRFVLFAVLAPAVGCLIFVLIHRLTGGQWAASLGPFLLAGVSLLPWIWLLALPLPLLPMFLRGSEPRLDSAAQGYESLPMVLARSGIYAVVFFWLSWAVTREDGRDGTPARPQRAWVGPVGLLVLVFTLTLLGDDWIAGLEPGWHSTGFALVWMTGQAVAGLALALVGGLATGAQPVATGSAGRALGLDWGNLLLATLFAWCYVAFAQFLIIWAGNLPAEISWFQHRSAGPWFLIPPLLALFGFLVPFLLLLSRRYKTKTGGLAAVALMLLLGQVAYTAWLILPAAGLLPPGGWLLAGALLLAGGAAFINRYAAAAQRLGRSSP
jgi:hypothetical protein